MKHPLILALVFFHLLVGRQPLPAQEDPTRLVFAGENKTGEVWANIALTGQRLGEDYIPLVIMVANHGGDSVTIDRDAIRLVGKDGRRYPMPSLKELRQGYKMTGIDGRAVSGAGIPYEVWQRQRRLVESNFFPNISSARRAIVIDQVNLPPSFAMIDLVYFAKPVGLAPGEAFLLEVHAIGWEVPIRVGIVLN